ncbi:MAG: hypothetical protein DCF22_04550 [Leptolyngbya sp.]|nr:MAG: hypothetical protein DCF22_04550 [Leptolyngbya sp.]
MTAIPNNEKWYIAELVMECQTEDEPRNVVHVNILLVQANSSEDAFVKAEQLGRESEHFYLNPNSKVVTWIYRGLRDLMVIDDELEHGAELMFEEEIGISEEDVQAMLSQKSQLNVFRPHKPRDADFPSYGSKDILDEVDRMINPEMIDPDKN